MTMQKPKLFRLNKGFTLIELLVVIAIIGILTSIVLVNMNTLRNKTKNVAIKVNMHNLPTAAEFYYEDKGTYWVSDSDNVCESSDFKNVKEAVERLSEYGNLFCGVDSVNHSAWVNCAFLNVENCYCVDSLGNKIEIPYETVICFSICHDLKDQVDYGQWMTSFPQICASSY